MDAEGEKLIVRTSGFLSRPGAVAVGIKALILGQLCFLELARCGFVVVRHLTSIPDSQQDLQ